MLKPKEELKKKQKQKKKTKKKKQKKKKGLSENHLGEIYKGDQKTMGG